MEILSWILAAIGIVGVYISGKKNRWGWALGTLYQLLWIVYAFFTAQYSFIIVCIVLRSNLYKEFL